MALIACGDGVSVAVWTWRMKKVPREAGGGRQLVGRGCDRRERMMGEYYNVPQYWLLALVLGEEGGGRRRRSAHTRVKCRSLLNALLSIPSRNVRFDLSIASRMGRDRARDSRTWDAKGQYSRERRSAEESRGRRQGEEVDQRVRLWVVIGGGWA